MTDWPGFVPGCTTLAHGLIGSGGGNRVRLCKKLCRRPQKAELRGAQDHVTQQQTPPCFAAMRSSSWAVLRRWPGPCSAGRLHYCSLNDNQGEQTGWHVPCAHCCPVRCSVLHVLPPALLGQQDFSGKATRAGPCLVLGALLSVYCLQVSDDPSF